MRLDGFLEVPGGERILCVFCGDHDDARLARGCARNGSALTHGRNKMEIGAGGDCIGLGLGLGRNANTERQEKSE
jgi:hypothetical protein